MTAAGYWFIPLKKTAYLCDMLTQRQLFLQHVAQTSPAPLALEIVRAEGVYLYDASGHAYIDLIAGISVSNVGHRHPHVVGAIKAQLDKYMHLMVYGEYVQSPQVLLAQRIAQLLPAPLSSCYFVNSGAEAVEGALKLAKRFTGRTGLVSFRNAYHGSTHGALSMMGDEFFKQAFRPLLPDVQHLPFGDVEALQRIGTHTAAVLVEPVQGEAGAIVPPAGFLAALRARCNETGTLLLFDEIQTGFGRTGKLFGFEHSGVIPDIILFAKGLGGGMPIGAFVSSPAIMQTLTENPVLGHITTFGGHPVSCAAALATIEVLVNENLCAGIAGREQLIRRTLVHSAISEIRGQGLLLAVVLPDAAFCMEVIRRCIAQGVITDWFLFCDRALRIAPPLNITTEVLQNACNIILQSIEETRRHFT